MNEEQRRAAIPVLDELMDKAADLRNTLNAVIEDQSLANESHIISASNRSYQLVNELQCASDALKRSGAARIQSYLTQWSHMRQEEDPEQPDPVFESITYDGENVWTVLMTTTTHGRERLVVHADTATWEEVSSATRV